MNLRDTFSTPNANTLRSESCKGSAPSNMAPSTVFVKRIVGEESRILNMKLKKENISADASFIPVRRLVDYFVALCNLLSYLANSHLRGICVIIHVLVESYHPLKDTWSYGFLVYSF